MIRQIRRTIRWATNRSPGLFIAAGNAPWWTKLGADYVCDGVDDHEEIQAALNELANTPSGGVLQFSKGTFTGDTKLTYNGPSLWLRGESSQATHFDWTGSFFELGAASGSIATFNMSDMEIVEDGGVSTTAVGVQSLSALTKGTYIARTRMSGFGGGEWIFNGATAFTFENNYISHNRASSTGNGLKIVENAGASWGVTTIRLRDNYFASTVSGANPLCYIEDVNTGLFEGNIYENLPAGTVGLHVEATSGNTANDLVFINEHFESFVDQPWEMVDTTNVVAIGCRGAVPTFTWDAIAAEKQHAIVMGKGDAGTGDITNLRHLLLGLDGVNDISDAAGVQIGPVDSGVYALGVMSQEDDNTGAAGIWDIYANDTGGTRRKIGSWGHFVGTAHASQPSSRFIVSAVPTAGGSLSTVFEAGANGVQLGSGGGYFSKALFGTVVWDPGELTDGATATTTVTVTGATQNGSIVSVGMNQISTGGWQLSGIVTSANTVTITLTNHTGGTVDLGAGAVRVMVVQV